MIGAMEDYGTHNYSDRIAGPIADQHVGPDLAVSPYGESLLGGANDRGSSVRDRVPAGRDRDVSGRGSSRDSVNVPLVAQTNVPPDVPPSTDRISPDVPLVAQGDVPPRTDGQNPVAHSVAQGTEMTTVPLVARAQCATSGTQALTIRQPKGYKGRRVKCATPKPIPGHEWRNLDSGWALFSRTASISQSGKRTSTRKYLRWYTQATIERIYGKAK